MHHSNPLHLQSHLGPPHEVKVHLRVHSLRAHAWPEKSEATKSYSSPALFPSSFEQIVRTCYTAVLQWEYTEEMMLAESLILHPEFILIIS